jgi:hypothetical protein
MSWKYNLNEVSTAFRGCLSTAFCASILLMCISGDAAKGETFWERTQLVDVSYGGGLSGTARSLGRGGYELSDGTPVGLRDWYSSDWQDLSVTLITQVSDNFGIYWGFSTGERGEAYRIEPGARVGFILYEELSENSAISISATALLGGDLREDSCTADYGAIGGVQKVNCRLAASFLEPARTLDYLVRESPPDRIRVNLRYTFRF